MVSHVRCDQPEQSRQERWLLKPVQRYVFVSRNTMDAGTIAHQPDQAEVLYDGVPLPRPDLDRAAARAHYGLPHDAFVVGMAARFHVQKDHETLVRAVQMLAARSPHLRVLLVGNHDAPSARDYVAQLEAALHLTGTRHLVTFAGLEMNMERFYAAIDVKVLSTHFEGLPLVLMEAMAAGRPVVATAVSGIPEVVEHGTTGFLVPRLQPQPLADALFTLADDPATAVRMGRAGRARVEALFSDTAYQRNVAALYGRLLGPPLRRPSVPAPGPVRPCGQTEAVTDQRREAAIGDQFADAAPDGGGLLQTVAAEAVGEVEIPEFRRRPDDGVMVEGIHVVMPRPGPAGTDALKGRHAGGEHRPDALLEESVLHLEFEAVRIFLVRRREAAQEALALRAPVDASRIDHQWAALDRSAQRKVKIIRFLLCTGSRCPPPWPAPGRRRPPHSPPRRRRCGCHPQAGRR